MSDVSPCLESQGCRLIPLYYLLSCSSAIALSVLSFFSVYWPIVLTVFPENSSISFVKRQAFWYGPCLAARR